MKLIPLAFVLCACRVVAGTEDLFLCDVDTCPGEGGGPVGGGNAGGSGAGGGCGDGELEVTVTVVGNIVVEVDSTGEQISGGTTSRCLPSGEQRLRASCSDDSNADVAWGNALCADVDDTCDFTLAEDETFVVDGASACE
jgi:hypothetical protein